jgi:hypothetical protein
MTVSFRLAPLTNGVRYSRTCDPAGPDPYPTAFCGSSDTKRKRGDQCIGQSPATRRSTASLARSSDANLEFSASPTFAAARFRSASSASGYTWPGASTAIG